MAVDGELGENRWRWVGPLCAGLLLRLAFVWWHPRFVGDTLIYGDLAHNMLAHHAYALTEDGVIRSTLIRLPGYPLFLALCFLMFGTANYVAVLWVQVAIDLLTCWLLGSLAASIWGQRAGRVCLWLAILCPFTANYVASPLTETLSIFCVTLALWACQRWLAHLGGPGRGGLGSAALVGLACCGAVLLRPDGILLSGAVLPVMAWVSLRQARVSQGSGRWGWFAGPAVVVTLLGITLGVWAARNWRVYHVVQPLAPKYANDPGESEPLGFARWYRTWAIGYDDTARVYWIYDGSAMDVNDLPARAFDSAAQRRETARVYALYNEETSSTPPVEAAFARLAAERIRTHPFRYYVLLPMARLGDMWLRPRTQLTKVPAEWWQPHTRPRATLFASVFGVLNLLLMLAACVGVVRWWRRHWAGGPALAAAMLGYVVLRSLLLMTIDNSEPRYVLEAFPVVLLLAALALAGSHAKVDMAHRPKNVTA